MIRMSNERAAFCGTMILTLAAAAHGGEEVPFGSARAIVLQADPGKTFLRLRAWFRAGSKHFDLRVAQVAVNGVPLDAARLRSPAEILQPRSQPPAIPRVKDKAGAVHFPYSHAAAGLLDWTYDETQEYSIWNRVYRQCDATVCFDLAGLPPDADGRYVVTLYNTLGRPWGKHENGQPKGSALVVEACELLAQPETPAAEPYLAPSWHVLRLHEPSLKEARRRWDDPNTPPAERGTLGWSLGLLHEMAGEEEQAVAHFRRALEQDAAFPEREEVRYRLVRRGLTEPSAETADKWGFARLGRVLVQARRGENGPGIAVLRKYAGTLEPNGLPGAAFAADAAHPWHAIAHPVSGEHRGDIPNEAKLAYTGAGLLMLFRGPTLPWLLPGTRIGEDQPVWDHNCVELFVSPGATLTQYYELNTNDAGGRFDGRQEWFFWTHPEWNGAWKCRARREEGRMEVAYFVPWSDFERQEPPAPGECWIGNIVRVQFLPDAQKNVTPAELSWGPLTQRSFHRLQDGMIWRFE